jgi:hypothetical protein
MRDDPGVGKVRSLYREIKGTTWYMGLDLTRMAEKSLPSWRKAIAETMGRRRLHPRHRRLQDVLLFLTAQRVFHTGRGKTTWRLGLK